ncbi:hypothetical protein PROFUN_11198 [Planoprotostelium fungivorum]|uniref:Lipid-binding serum glycoprotein C-terminal domain-containing protein n=1 Tax=Planoprotostelium fungivorum TaxID=1890364 RepID=A0A2P6NAU8_9EUKA|nr:hypothetical protein PROFUN_11198 [Planoprotostelium fungivorum]
MTQTYSWFYNLLIDVLSPLIQNTISTQLTNAIQNVAQTKINEVLKQVPIRQSIKTPLVFDIGLLRDPEFDSSSFRLYESGASYDSLNPTECPKDVCPQRVLPNTITQRMAQVYVSDYVANSMGYAAYQSGFIHVEVTPDMVPSTSILKLNTNSLNGILPKLAATYPNASVYLDIVGTRAPAVTFNSTTEATFTVYLQIEISVGVKDEKVKAITIEGDISGSATVRTNNSIVYPAIGRAATFNWNVTQSSIGDFNSKPLFGATKLAYSTVTNVVNNKFKEGISLPTVEGLEFVNPTLTWSDGFFSVEVDFVYHPPTL